MVRLEQDVLLVLDVLDLLLLQQEVLVNALHRVHLSHLAVRDQEDLAKAALVNDLGDLEVLKVHLLTMDARLTDEALACPIVLFIFLLIQLLLRVVLGKVWRLEYHKVIENIIAAHLIPALCLGASAV